MNTTIKNIFQSNLFLTLIALYLGYFVWVTISSHQTTTLALKIPLSYYNTNTGVLPIGPETIHVHLTGKRRTLATLDKNTLALHIDAQKLHKGQTTVTADQQKLFLPASISSHHFEPNLISIAVEDKDTLS